MTRSVHLIINPKAGQGRARRALPAVLQALRNGLDDIDLQVQQTSSPTDAKARIKAAGERLLANVDEANPPALLVMGGDGMVSLGINAVAGTPVRFGVIPVGTGNDFVRGMSLPDTPEAAVAAIVAGKQRQVDLTYIEGNLVGGTTKRWVGSIVSTGYDALVNRRTNRRVVHIGSLGYGIDALVELAKFTPMNYRLTIDGVRRDEVAMLVAVGNAGFFGGGMHVCPDADPADGLLDLTIIHPVGRMTLLRLLPEMYSGKFVRDPCVERLRARQVTVDGDRMFGMADGEDLGHVPLDCTCVANILWLLGVNDAPAESTPV